MISLDNIKREIVVRLSPLKPQKIILFGSYAYGKPSSDSDIDLYIVTKDDFIPKNFKESSEIFLQYSNKIRDLQKQIPIDIITHTKAMHKKFVESKSSFSKEILKDGIRLI